MFKTIRISSFCNLNILKMLVTVFTTVIFTNTHNTEVSIHIKCCVCRWISI